MPTFTATNPVTAGKATKTSHYDTVFNNTLALRDGAIAAAGQANGDFMIATSATQVTPTRSYVKIFAEVFGD